MADAKKVTLYAPSGQKVTVVEARGVVLKGRGYTSTKPKPAVEPEPAQDTEPEQDEDTEPEQEPDPAPAKTAKKS